MMQNGPIPEPGRITKVERQEKQAERYNIYIENQYAFSVYEDTLIKHRLLKDQQVEAHQIRDILLTDELQKGYRAAVHSLSRRMKTEQELLQFLDRKGFDREISKEIVSRLKEQGYIDDFQFALSLTRQRIFSQKKGRLYIRHELLHMGVSKQRAADALEQINPDAEYEQALNLALKKWNRLTERTRDNKRKIAAFLQRRGYPMDIIMKVLKELKEQTAADAMDDEFF